MQPYACVHIHASLSLNNAKNCRGISEWDLNSAFLKVVGSSRKIFQFSDMHSGNLFLTLFEVTTYGMFEGKTYLFHRI